MICVAFANEAMAALNWACSTGGGFPRAGRYPGVAHCPASARTAAAGESL